MLSGFKNVVGRFKGMRKDNDWVVCPVSNASDNVRYIQSSTRIAKVDLESGKAIVSKYHSNGSYNHDLLAIRGAKELDCPQDILDQLRAFDDANGGKPVAFIIGGSGNNRYLNEEERRALDE